MSLSLLIAVIVPFAFTAWLTTRFYDPASKLHILDHPNERSLHTNPTPRSGGVAILGGIFAGLAWGTWRFAWPMEIPWLVASIVLVALVSFMDDRSGVGVAYRFAAHMIAAGLLVVAGLAMQSLPFPGMAWPLATWLAVAISALFIVWMINLYNFMDGMDGFAGGMAVIGFGAFALLGWHSGHTAFLIVSLVTASASAGFLLFNFPPARIFMGDVGSSVLGLLAAALSLWGARDDVFPLWVALLVFSPFIVDATVTLLRRAFKGEKVWQAHRTHYYQRLVQMGWGHRKTVLWEYVLMIAVAISALWGIDKSASTQWAILGAWVVLYVLLATGLRHFEERHRNHEKLA
jgi:UDP-N-acetylmuramyl pentapeptide phosphotransferase/UDP-N-acetylglucosamine-1-phosphate transferase